MRNEKCLFHVKTARPNNVLKGIMILWYSMSKSVHTTSGAVLSIGKCWKNPHFPNMLPWRSHVVFAPVQHGAQHVDFLEISIRDARSRPAIIESLRWDMFKSMLWWTWSSFNEKIRALVGLLVSFVKSITFSWGERRWCDGVAMGRFSWNDSMLGNTCIQDGYWLQQ